MCTVCNKWIESGGENLLLQLHGGRSTFALATATGAKVCTESDDFSTFYTRGALLSNIYYYSCKHYESNEVERERREKREGEERERRERIALWMMRTYLCNIFQNFLLRNHMQLKYFSNAHNQNFGNWRVGTPKNGRKYKKYFNNIRQMNSFENFEIICHKAMLKTFQYTVSLFFWLIIISSNDNKPIINK